MLYSLVLAASMLGQSVDNAGKIWAGNGYIFAAYDISKPVHFDGGGLSMDLHWDAVLDGYGGGFRSLPFIVAGCQWPVWLEFYPRFDPDGNTWGLLERDGHSVGDWDIQFDSANTGPLANISRTLPQPSRLAPLAGTLLWAIRRADVSGFTLSQ